MIRLSVNGRPACMLYPSLKIASITYENGPPGHAMVFEWSEVFLALAGKCSLVHLWTLDPSKHADCKIYLPQVEAHASI